MDETPFPEAIIRANSAPPKHLETKKID